MIWHCAIFKMDFRLRGKALLRGKVGAQKIVFASISEAIQIPALFRFRSGLLHLVRKDDMFVAWFYLRNNAARKRQSLNKGK
ncbi:hypothetical protein [Legionella sp. 16cNR16C]|uniref:hypothetical protein n=1 Tax=Legionella sp. 16cNR16C TaxID=2905656 RepID=UPI001E2FE7ED|nr:hypothetical protein [Legionella sp. 16cNR16C]MCE3046119.1 hypothetical protein [Legionella sp. 16cNR16C]